MRCVACNEILTEAEDSRITESGHLLSLCDNCYDYIEEDVPAVVRRNPIREEE